MNEKLNIVMIYDTASIAGGAGKIAIRSALALAATGKFNVYYFAAEGPACQELINSDVQVICLDMPIISRSKSKVKALLYGLWNRKAYRTLSELLKCIGPERTLVHVHGWSKALSSSIFKATKRLKVHTLVTMHDYFTVCPNGGFFQYPKNRLCSFKPLSFRCLFCNCDKRSYIQKIYRCIRQIIQNRYLLKNPDISYAYISNRIYNLNSRYLASDSFYYLRNPVDLVPQKRIDHSTSNIYICVGRLSEEKGVEAFCKAVSMVKKDENIRGIVVGTGPLYDSLVSRYPEIEFSGWVEGDAIKAYYEEARALVFPSLCNEGSPLAIPEAFVYGLPCIVSNSSSAIEFIEDGVNGYIYETQDIEDMCNKLRESLNSSVIAYMQSNIEHSFDIASYSYEKYIESLMSIYDDIMSN